MNSQVKQIVLAERELRSLSSDLENLKRARALVLKTKTLYETSEILSGLDGFIDAVEYQITRANQRLVDATKTLQSYETVDFLNEVNA